MWLHHSDYFTFNAESITYVPFTVIIFIDVQIVLSLAMGTLEIMSLFLSCQLLCHWLDRHILMFHSHHLLPPSSQFQFILHTSSCLINMSLVNLQSYHYLFKKFSVTYQIEYKPLTLAIKSFPDIPICLLILSLILLLRPWRNTVKSHPWSFVHPNSLPRVGSPYPLCQYFFHFLPCILNTLLLMNLFLSSSVMKPSSSAAFPWSFSIDF